MTPASSSRTGTSRSSGSRPDDRPITPDDLQQSLRELAGPVNDGVQQAKATGLVVAVAVGAVLVIGAFVIGRRKGRKRSTIVEIRRI